MKEKQRTIKNIEPKLSRPKQSQAKISSPKSILKNSSKNSHYDTSGNIVKQNSSDESRKQNPSDESRLPKIKGSMKAGRSDSSPRLTRASIESPKSPLRPRSRGTMSSDGGYGKYCLTRSAPRTSFGP